MFEVIRSNIEIALNNQPRIVRLRSNLVQSFITLQAIRGYTANVQGQR